MDERTILEGGEIEVGSWVVVTGPRYRGRKGKVVSIFNEGTVATVRGNFGAWAQKGRIDREFRVEHLSLYSEDMDRGGRPDVTA